MSLKDGDLATKRFSGESGISRNHLVSAPMWLSPEAAVTFGSREYSVERVAVADHGYDALRI